MLGHDLLPAWVRRQVAGNRRLNVNRLHPGSSYPTSTARKAPKCQRRLHAQGCGARAGRLPAVEAGGCHCERHANGTPRLTPRIRRRRAQDVADTTDSLRVAGCIRFVRPRLWIGAAHRYRRSIESRTVWSADMYILMLSRSVSVAARASRDLCSQFMMCRPPVPIQP